MRRDNQGENPSRRRFAFEAKLSGVLEHDRRIPIDVPADLQTGARIAKELVQRCLVRLRLRPASVTRKHLPACALRAFVP